MGILSILSIRCVGKNNWVRKYAPFCVSVAACTHGRMLQHSWLFATSFEPLCELASKCAHPVPHPSLVGERVHGGEWPGDDAAEYPEPLAQNLARLLQPLFSWGSQQSGQSLLQHIPLKSVDAPPHSNTDGGGYVSQPDWSKAFPSPNRFKLLRDKWIPLLLELGLHHELQRKLQTPLSEPPFAIHVVDRFRSLFQQCFQEDMPNMDWSVAQHQPFCLNALEQVSVFMRDADTDLFRSLKPGVSTGFEKDIPPSHVFAPKLNEEDFSPSPLSSHFLNWKSAEDHPDITCSLIQEELRNEWLFAFPGTLDDARARWPLGVALGKLGIAFADNRAPRLVLDNSICGTNGACWIPEKQNMPTASDVIRSFPL